MGQNYFNTLPLRLQLQQLGKCRFMDRAEFADGVNKIRDKKMVIVGCGAQGLNQGLNLRDSGLDVSYALRESAIVEQRQSWKNATENGFTVGTYEELIPQADMVLNLTPDKQHTSVVQQVMPLMKQGACLAYSHGFNIVEEGMQIRDDLTVIMVAPKCPGTEVREEYKRGFGVPTLIAVHTENDPNGDGLELAKAYAAGTGGHRAGVLQSSFIAEVKSDLMGEQTILCGMLQTGAILCFDKMVEKGIAPEYASKLIQYGWETVTEGLKHGGITNMMDRLSNPAKIRAYHLADELKDIMRPLYEKHQEFYDHGILLVAMIKSGVELAFETMVSAGIIAESAYYESLHETPLIANTIARKKLYEMNVVISDTAEYGCYLFDHACRPLLADFMSNIDTDVIGRGIEGDNGVDNAELIAVNEAIRVHPVEIVGKKLRGYMTAMKRIV
jgi:ketol-acid reductoisomerase